MSFSLPSAALATTKPTVALSPSDFEWVMDTQKLLLMEAQHSCCRAPRG